MSSEELSFFCTQCGLKMDVFSESVRPIYSRETGEKTYSKTIIYRCPLYEEGYSDHHWHTHDEYRVEIKVNSEND